MLGPLLFIHYTREKFELVNRLYSYADDSTLLADVHKPADRPAVAASLNGDLARIQSGAISGPCYCILTKLRL